jgi:hypothetical protein
MEPSDTNADANASSGPSRPQNAENPDGGREEPVLNLSSSSIIDCRPSDHRDDDVLRNDNDESSLRPPQGEKGSHRHRHRHPHSHPSLVEKKRRRRNCFCYVNDDWYVRTHIKRRFPFVFESFFACFFIDESLPKRSLEAPRVIYFHCTVSVSMQ